MNDSFDFLKSVLDTITEHVVVIDLEGDISFVNKSWISFGENNACLIDGAWRGVNYLEECDKAAAMGDEYGLKAGKGIRSVIKNDEEEYYFEYPCHSPEENRWFMMRVTPFSLKGDDYFVISHQNITERKLAENEVEKLSRLDGLTGIANRRTFDEFLESEWKRCKRLGIPISLALLDLDHFKLLNDTYGHQAGDECLKSVGRVLEKYSGRPSDICARYGGEEFAIVYGNTNLDQAKMIASKVLDEIRSLNIPNEKAPTSPTLTASIGLAEMHPASENDESQLVKMSDDALYQAKESGRDKVSIHLD